MAQSPNNSKATKGGQRPRKRAVSPAQKKVAKQGRGSATRPDEDRIFSEHARRDISGVVLIVLAIVLLVAAVLPTNAVVTSFVSSALHLCLGLGAYLLPVFLAACGVSFIVRYDQVRISTRIAIGLSLVLVAVLTLLALTMPPGEGGGAPAQIFDPEQLTLRGGYIGAALAWAGYTLFGQVISIIIMVGVIVIGIIVIGFSFSGIIEKSRQRAAEQKQLELQLENVEPAPPYEIAGDAPAGFVPVRTGADQQPTRAFSSKARRAANSDKSDTQRQSSRRARPHFLDIPETTVPLTEAQTITRKLGSIPKDSPEAKGHAQSPAEKKAAKAKTKENKANDSASSTVEPETQSDGFTLPSPSLLRFTDPTERAAQNDEELRDTARCLQETLEDFKIMAEVVGWVAGPTVTLFKVDLPAGVRVSRVTALEADIALALAAPGVRIFAPIPKTNYVGIEVPNRTRRTVYLGDVLQDAPAGPLQIAIGEDVEGNHIVTDLAKMPHLLIGGTTGSGKSVSINAMIMSILMRATPSEVRFIMIDPKRVEFTPYNGIPHLYVPVVTEAKEAASALAWGVAEMERRLKVFSKVGARNIGQFNEMAEKELAQIEKAKAAEKEPPEQRYGDKLPYIVIIIDELADLMMNVGKEVEFSISRIAQLARAAGIHLIVATQRPSTNVVTGLIKANITNRIAFNVASGIDSRVILDTPGAERLIGLGDLLFSKPEYAKPQRMQACFVSNEEISAVVDMLKEQGEPEYHTEILQTNVMSLGDTQPDGSGGSVSEDDPLLWEAAEVVVSSGFGSTSGIQRRLKVGYSRAGRIMDMLENKGIVGPPNGSKPREVLVDEMELETLKAFESHDRSGE